MVKKAVALLRVSTDQQELGHEAQRASIKAFAEKQGIEVVSFHVETMSGGAPFEKRVVLHQALEEVARVGADYLVVSARDRLSRDPLCALLVENALAKVEAGVLMADGNNAMDPASELLRLILDGVARFERRMIGIRTKAALAVLKGQGVRVGRPPGRKSRPGSAKTGKKPGPGPTMEEVVAARSAGRSWGEIAREYQVPVGRVQGRFRSAKAAGLVAGVGVH